MNSIIRICIPLLLASTLRSVAGDSIQVGSGPLYEYMDTTTFVNIKFRNGFKPSEIADMIKERSAISAMKTMIIAASNERDASRSRILLTTAEALGQELFKKVINSYVEECVKHGRANEVGTVLKCVNNPEEIELQETDLIRIFDSKEYGKVLLKDDGAVVSAYLKKVLSLMPLQNKAKFADAVTAHIRLIESSPMRYNSDYKVKELAEEILDRAKDTK